MFINNRPDALGLIGRAAGQPAQAIRPVAPARAGETAGAVGSVSRTATGTGAKAEAETAQLKIYLANITRADAGTVIALTEQAARNTSRATYDAVVSAYGDV